MNNDEMDFTDARMLRIIAERQLKENQNKINPVTETDPKKLIHELQVHQIELEMQNEELLHAYDVAEKALKKYTMLYDFAPMGYFTIDSEGNICDLNFTAAEMLGDRRISLVNSNFKLFVSEESRPDFNTFFSKVFTSGLKESCEVKLGYDNKPLCLAYIEGIVIDEDQKCLMSVVDISNFKK
jgi:PAS domain S-box-containing protein